MHCRRVELDELLEQSDIISISVPLSDSTRHMFNEESIGRMKKGAWLVSVSRTCALAGYLRMAVRIPVIRLIPSACSFMHGAMHADLSLQNIL